MESFSLIKSTLETEIYNNLMEAYRKAGSPPECIFIMDRNLNFYIDDPGNHKGILYCRFWRSVLLSGLDPEYEEHEIKKIAMRFYRGLDE